MPNNEINMDVQGQGSASVSMNPSVDDAAFVGRAEAWAVGKRNGTDVPSTDPAYHNNAKYYATEAAASAEDAHQYTAAAVHTWLENNVDPETGYVLDRTLSEKLAAAPADMVGDLKSAIINFTEYYDTKSTWTITTSQRNHIYLGQTNANYKLTVGSGAWMSVQGWSNATYDGTKVYDSGSFTETKEFQLLSRDTSLYYCVVLGVSSGSISNAQREASKVYKNGIAVDTSLTAENYPADSASTGEAIKGVTEYAKSLSISWETSTRGYTYLGLFNGKVSVTVGANVWVALQGWDSATYDGTKKSDTGAIYTATTFTISSETTGYYYRLVFGSSSGISPESKMGCSATYNFDSKELIGEMVKGNKPASKSLFTVMHGGTAVYPSNTLGLYKKAYKNNIMYWECDVRPCSDGYVLCHDNDIYNHAVTSNGETIAQNTVLISQNTVATLQTYKFGVITNKQSEGVVPGFENDTIPTLQQFLLLAKAFGAYPVLEIKFTPTQQQITDICNIVKQTGMLDNTYILAYLDAGNVISYSLQNGIKRLVIIINNGECSNNAVDTAYGYISDDFGQLDDVIFDPAIANYSASVAEYAATKGMRMGVWSVPEFYNQTTIKNLYNGYCTAYTSDKYDVAEIIRDMIM